MNTAAKNKVTKKAPVKTTQIADASPELAAKAGLEPNGAVEKAQAIAQAHSEKAEAKRPRERSTTKKTAPAKVARGSKTEAALREGKKECSRCHEVKPLEAFQKNVTHKDGRQSACAECHSAKKEAVKA